MGRVLAIDLGTTLYKYALFERTGELGAILHVPPPIVSPHAGYMESKPEAFLSTHADGIRQLIEQVGGSASDIEVVTFSTQANSFVLLDTANRPLTSIVHWPDRRAEAIEAEVVERGDVPGFTDITGIPKLNHLFMAAKLVWYAKNEPALWSQVARIALISDYFTLWLTGRHVTEAGTAGLSGLVDIYRCEWHPELVGRFGLRDEWLPRIVRSGTNLGPILVDTAKSLGLPTTCRFVVGCLDQYAGAIGVGNVVPGMLSETTGTVLATVTCCEAPLSRANPGVFTGPAFRDGLFWRMVFGDVSANIMQWYRDQLPDKPAFAELSELAGSVSAGAAGLSLRKGTPLTSLTTVFDGASPQHSRGHYARSIMEGVAEALDEQIKSLGGGASKDWPGEIRSAGGGAKSSVWLQIKADRIGLPVVTTTCPEPTSLGAAIVTEASLTGESVADVAGRWIRLSAARLPSSQP